MSDFDWDSLPAGTYRCKVLWDKENHRIIPDVRTARRMGPMEAKAKYVEPYPRKKTTYETSDGQVFDQQYKAVAHQHKLEVAGWLNSNYFHGDAEGAMMMAEKMLKVWSMDLKPKDEGEL